MTGDEWNPRVIIITHAFELTVFCMLLIDWYQLNDERTILGEGTVIY